MVWLVGEGRRIEKLQCASRARRAWSVARYGGCRSFLLCKRAPLHGHPISHSQALVHIFSGRVPLVISKYKEPLNIFVKYRDIQNPVEAHSATLHLIVGWFSFMQKHRNPIFLNYREASVTHFENYIAGIQRRPTTMGDSLLKIGVKDVILS